MEMSLCTTTNQTRAGHQRLIRKLQRQAMSRTPPMNGRRLEKAILTEHDALLERLYPLVADNIGVADRVADCAHSLLT